MLLVVLVLVLCAPLIMPPGDVVVVYCAHDAVYAQEILTAFEQETGIRVDVKFDTETTKSLGLTNLLLAEKDSPRADVFWNNQLLGTLELEQKGVLQAYKGPGWDRIPEKYRDPDALWTGFAARLRVWIINTDLVEPVGDGGQYTHEQIESLMATDLSNMTVAKPMFGTTLSHYSVLWDLLGGEAVKEWHADWRKRGVIEASSNGETRDLVAAGTCHIGWTDTDDAFSAMYDGKPVTLLPYRLPTGQTIAMPNTVAMIKGCKHPEAAKQLIDFLLSAKVEQMLANSDARQIPLGDVDESALPADVRDLRDDVRTGYPMNGLSEARIACLAWLLEIYSQ